MIIGCNKKQEATFYNNPSKIAATQDHFTTPVAETSTNDNVRYATEQLDNTKGLSNSSVNTIFQDSENLLWIGTWDGLNRYDGQKFKIFRPELNKDHSLSNQVVLKIDEDHTGQLWVLTMHGINRYDKKTNTFTNYYFSRKEKPPFSESEFNMALDPSKQVYCAVKDWGIGYFDGTDFRAFDPEKVPFNGVKKMAFRTNGQLLLQLNTHELYVLTIESGAKGKKVVSKVDLLLSEVSDFEMVSEDAIYLVRVSGAGFLYSFDTNSESLIDTGDHTRIIARTNEGVLLHHDSGYSVMDSLGQKINKPWVNHLKGQKITTMLQGTENVIWQGTDGDGLFKMYPLKKTFNLVAKAQIPEMEGGIVRTFLEVKDNSFWVGTKGSGLFKLPPEFYLHPDQPWEYQNFNERNSTINNSVFSLYKGKEDLIFIGSDGDGITVYDLRTSRLLDWSEIIGHDLCSYFKSTYTIYQDDDGVIWLGTNGYGMIAFKISRMGEKLEITNFKQYLAANKALASLSSNIIFSIIPKNDQELWIGTRLGGLNLFNKKNQTFKTFKHVKDDPNSLSNNDILNLHIDSKQRLWVGTSLGLNMLSEYNSHKMPEFQNFTVKEGLPNNTIHGIVSDKNENLWISTNFGLSNFIVKDSKFINYSKTEGLQDNEFSDGAIYKIPTSDYIAAGGVKGFNYFTSSRIEESDVIPNMLIDEISGHNKEVPYYQSLVISPDSNLTPSIVLNHDQNFFDIRLSAITYINNEKCQYAYRLNNFDQNWNVIKGRHTFSFTNVPKGDYELWLKWSNSDGIWGDPVKAMDIQIKPVFWQSNAAMVVYFILLVLFVLFVWSYFNKQYSLRQNIISQRKEEEIHQNRLNFFTNVAHEFQTPLTLILGPIHKLAKSTHMVETDQKFVSMIERNSSRLLFLTQQLLEFRKAEHGHLGIVLKQFDLVNLVEQIAELFDEWALQKNIDYTLEIASELSGWFDKDKVEIILFNLLSNAFKYTPENGKISLSLSIEGNDLKTLTIEVTNSGKGIPKEKLDTVFDRYFLADNKVDHDKFRTGIGLAYIKKMATLLKGTVFVSSEANKATTFKVSFLCSKSGFDEQALDYEEGQILISGHLQNIVQNVTGRSHTPPDKIAALDHLIHRKKTILIVEDEKEIHGFLNELLKDHYKILTAFNGVEALEILKYEEPDLIISDVMMPKMDGIEFCNTVKGHIKSCHIPFIMLTAKDNVLHRIEGLESGANAYIPKPFHPNHLLVRIEKLLEEKELILKHFSQDTITTLPVNNDDKDLVEKVLAIIRNNIDNEHLRLSDIEEELAMSSSTFYRKIKEIFGFSPSDLIRTLRLKHAAELLVRTNLTVSEVCYQSGFNNRSYFYREFKKLYNSTPKEYQLLHQRTGV